ncbi:RNA polymerase sigma24 factor [Rhizocola hellebori]|uniref:RNA polymerase sigma24 factor n=1 Tax=Rhizocola hellebori TaxID=1392758 RepID=A0A8J3Q1E3_9ACTN|nr:SigE family RNA polymerase sigma factor [Rhizocola hellebori]GIH02013.1 RNA polymerase sigma24 factor [Rhizocola hellebori]
MEADRASFEVYVQARTAALSRVAYLLTGDHHLAEDLVQQTFLRVAGVWQRVAAQGDPDPYVRRVLYHQHVSWWRQARRLTQVSLSGADRPVDDRADQIGVTLVVQRALAKLAPKQRAALVLRYFEDLTEAQTAEILGCRVGTVKSQVRDGLARLRQLAPELADLLEVKA